MESMMDLASDSEFLPELSKAGREVLQGLLSLVPEKRLTAADALSHRWFEEEDAPLFPVLSSQKDRKAAASNPCSL
jgi:cell division cycle 2-like protein